MTSMQVISESFRAAFQSRRLVYTALEDTDRCRDLWWRCRSSDLVNRNLVDASPPTPPSRAASDRHLVENITSEPKPYLAVLVCLPATDPEPEPEPIGFVILNRSFPECASFHIALLAAHQGRGYGREAITWAADYAFRWRNLHRLSIGCLAYNERAAHLYADMGFLQEARTRSCFYVDGAWHDLVEFGMLREEWEERRASTELGWSAKRVSRVQETGT